MATLKDRLRDILDNRIRATASGYQKLRDLTTLDDKFVAGVNRVKSQPLSTYNIANPKTFAKAWNRSAPYNILNPATFAKTARSGSNALNFVGSRQLPQQNNPILQGLGSAGQEIVRNTGQGLKAMATGIEQRKPLTFAAGAFRTAAPVVGAYASPAYSLGGMALGGTIGALTNKDKASGFGEGAVQGLKTAAVTRFTDPVISKGLSRLAPGSSLLKRQVAQRVGGGLANVAEDEIIARIDQLKTSTPEKALSFIIGAGISGNDQLIDAAKNALRKGDKKQIKRVANTLVNELQAKYKGETPPGYRSTRGSNQYVNIVEPSKPKFSSDLNRQLGLDPYPKNALQDLNAVGAVAGLEQDEEGKWRYNPQKGAAGLAVATLGTKATKGKLNLENLAIDKTGREALQQINEDIPTSVISNKSVIDRARTAKGTKALTDEKMRDIIAQQLKNRQKVVDLAAQFSNAKKAGASEEELAKIMLEISEQSRVAQQGGTFAGRLLQAQNIMADRSATPMQKVLALLDNAGIKEERYLKDAVKVDWENPVEVVRFYRKYVPPSLGEVLTEIRYTNMLSSPMTHIVNIASNALQTAVVAPLEKTISGTIDAFRSPLTKSERKYYANAGIEYAKGYVKALPRAIKKAIDILSQKEISVKPDLEYVPTGVGGKLGAYTTPLRALEAMDQFFKTLVEGGVSRELRSSPRNLPSTKIAKIASQEAEYRLFRQKFDPTGELGQGYVLQLFDLWNSAILNLRRLPGGKWILPFMQTPTNILKQGLEYSPLGVVTIPGSKNATEQLSKSIIGSGVFLAAYQLAKSGLTTWSAPTGEKERELYYAAGLQPYSVKIGDKWVSYSKLGPLSYPIAMAAALANAERTKPDQETKNNIAESIVGILAFFGDQSYVENIGDLVDAIQGGVSVGPTAISSQAANLAGQLVPYRSFLTWLGRITDPTYRKAKTFKERMVKDIPIIGSGLEPYRDPFGNPSMRDLPLVNAFFPARISVEKQPAEREYRLYEQGKIQRGIEKRSGEKLLEEGEPAVISSDKYQYIDQDGSVKTIDIGKVLSMPEDSAMNKAKKENEVWQVADKILTSNLAPNLQASALQRLGVDIEQAEYYNIAKETNDLKYLYIEEEINKIISTTKNREDVLKFLVKQRQEVGGKVILSSGVIDDLRKAGYISKAEADKLKNITFDGKTATPQVRVSGRGGGATLKSIKLTAPKMGSIRGKIPSLAQTKITPPSAKDPFGIKQFNPQDVVRQFSKQVQASQEAVARIRPISRSSFNI